MKGNYRQNIGNQELTDDPIDPTPPGLCCAEFLDITNPSLVKSKQGILTVDGRKKCANKLPFIPSTSSKCYRGKVCNGCAFSSRYDPETSFLYHKQLDNEGVTCHTDLDIEEKKRQCKEGGYNGNIIFRNINDIQRAKNSQIVIDVTTGVLQLNPLERFTGIIFYKDIDMTEIVDNDDYFVKPTEGNPYDIFVYREWNNQTETLFYEEYYLNSYVIQIGGAKDSSGNGNFVGNIFFENRSISEINPYGPDSSKGWHWSEYDRSKNESCEGDEYEDKIPNPDTIVGNCCESGFNYNANRYRCMLDMKCCEKTIEFPEGSGIIYRNGSVKGSNNTVCFSNNLYKHLDYFKNQCLQGKVFLKNLNRNFTMLDNAPVTITQKCTIFTKYNDLFKLNLKKILRSLKYNSGYFVIQYKTSGIPPSNSMVIDTKYFNSALDSDNINNGYNPLIYSFLY